MKSIVLVNCYFGNFPWYFPFFIKSCITNPTVDFKIFSDSEYKGYLPNNVKIIPITLNEFNKISSEKLGFEINVKKAYKLCDFKPAYGVIFSDYISHYDYWGMCDIDIILGRIREFITEDLLNEYDIVNTRHDYLTGSFLLFKNIEKINNLFKTSKDYIKVFTNEKHYCFDECNFKHMQIEMGMDIFDVPCEIESMEHIIKKNYKLNNINVFFDFLVIDGLSGKLKFDDGLLSYDNKFEILLYHLIQYKSNVFLNKNNWTYIPNKFYIDKYTFRKKSKKTLQGIFNYIYENIYKPNKSSFMQILDYLLSIILSKNKNNLLTNGMYKNKLGDTYIYIENNRIILNNYSGKKIKLIFSKLKFNTFFADNKFSVKYNYFNSASGNTEIIQSIKLDGSVINYEIISVFKK